MGHGDANDLTNTSSGQPSGGAAAEPRELSGPAAVAVTVLAAVCGAAVMLAFFHWLGWSIPVLGVLVAKLGIKLAVGGVAGFAAAVAWLRARRGAR